MGESQKRTLDIHFADCVQRLKFYSGSSREDLLAGIREVLGIKPGAPLRFRDEDGDIVLLSAGMPSGTVLHVAVEEGVPFHGTRTAVQQPAAPQLPARGPPQPTPQPASSQPTPQQHTAPAQQQPRPAPAAADANWRRWVRASGAKLSDDGLTAKAAEDASAWALYTPALPISGKHYLVIDFPETRPCCAAIGVVPGSLASVAQRTHLLFSSDPVYSHVVSLKGLGRGPSGARDSGFGSEMALRVGVYLDCDARMLVFVDHTDAMNPHRAIRLDGIPMPAVFVAAAPKHGIKCKILPGEPLPPGGVFTGASARVDMGELRLQRAQEQRQFEERRRQGEAKRKAEA